MHHLHISVTDMKVDAQKGTVEMSIRMYAVDLETMLHNKYNIHERLEEPSRFRAMLEEYVNERFSIVVNNDERVGLVVDSITMVEEMVWFHIRGAAKRPIEHIEINNRLLTEYFSSQSNLMIISATNNERDRTFRLDRRNFKVEFAL